MNNYDLSYSEIKARGKSRNRIKARIKQSDTLYNIKMVSFAAVVFLLVIAVSNMAFNDCLHLGVC